MSDVPDNVIPPPVPGESLPSGSLLPGEAWTRKKFNLFLVAALVLHVALIFLLGTKQPIIPRPVTAVPRLQLADSSDAFIALSDPTLFTRPNAHDLATVFWRRLKPPQPPNFSFNQIAAPSYLPPTEAGFGAYFFNFVQSHPGDFSVNFKPEPRRVVPDGTWEEDLGHATTLQISGDLAGRRLLTALELPALPANDVIEPSRVQVLVDTLGNVVSAVVLQPASDNAGNQRALQLVRNLRFAPAPRLMFGEITFAWHTVPLTATNEPGHPLP